MTKISCKAALVLFLALSLFLAGSGGGPVPQRPDRVEFADLVPFPDFDRDPRYSPMMAQYEAILRGEGRYLDGAGEVDLQHINKSVSSDDHVTATAEEFAVVDLDGDGAVEVILRLTVNGNKGEAYVILYSYDGDIYGNTLFIRQFGTLKENGTLSYPDGIRVLRFDGGKLIYHDAISAFREESVEIIGHQKNGSLITKSTKEYYVNEEIATKEAYSEMIETYKKGQRNAKW